MKFIINTVKNRDFKWQSGMKKKELRQRFSKKRKTSGLMSMIRKPVNKRFSASYVPVDSWFLNSQLVQFVFGQ